MSEWQPIETAPRGSPLLGEDGPELRVRWATSRDYEGRGYFGRGAGGMGPRWNDTKGRAMQRPTHWKALASTVVPGERK